ncbi:MAG: matrixin family metalloprotease [Nitrosotalea sp.]
MELFYKITIVGVVLALSAGSIPQSFADGFQPPLFKWLYAPTICALEPSDPKFPGLGQKMLSAVQDAVLDWQTKLNGGNARNGVWNLNLIEIPFSETSSYDATKCDITVNFKPSPDDPNEQFTEAGVTVYKDFPKVCVTIYYLGVDVHERYVTFWQNGTLYYTYQSTPYFTGYLATDPQLSMTIRHELGHSLGLGHYIVSNAELAQIIQGYQDMPSIMITTIFTYGVTHFDITPLDIKEIQSIYGTSGLPISQSNSQITSLPSVIQSSTSNQSQTGTNQTQTVTSLPSQIPSWVKNIAKWWSVNQVSDNEFVSAMKYLIDQKILQVSDTPSSSASGQIPSWVKTNAGYWADGKISDSEFIRGIQYLISIGILNL